MDNCNTLGRLYNDVISSIYKEPYIINQENDINKYNTFQKKHWSHSIDAYSINMKTINYQGNYVFDKKKTKPYNISPLFFISYSNHSGLDFLDFINKILMGDPKIFVHVNNFEITDLRKKTFEITEININNTDVDDLLLQNIRKYFHSLRKINFRNCNIKKECNFNNIKCDIEFDKSNIENIRVFNDTKANLNFLRTNINKISPTTILSNRVEFPCNNGYIYKELFLKCNFPNLENFSVHKEKEFVEYSYLDQFKFLPTSAPNLENLYIEGKLSSFDFLLDMKNLLRCNIDSIFDFQSNFYPDVDTKEEREKLLKRNRYQYEVRKMITNSQDKFIIGSLELERILKSARSNKLLGYDKGQLNELLNNGICVFKKLNDGEITKFYESYYNTLILRNTLNEPDVRLGLEDTLFKIDKFIYIDRTYRRLNYNKRIVPAKTFIYNYDGTPIIFMNRKKPITTLEEAKKFIEKYRVGGNYNIENALNEDEYNAFVEIISSLDEEIKIGNLLDWINEETHYKVTPDSFRKFGEGGRYIAGIYEKYKRTDKRYDDIRRKSEQTTNSLLKLISDNYEKFTVEEKLYMYYDITNYDISKNRYAITSDIYNLKDMYKENLIESINLKTNYLYKKYVNILKMTYDQLYLGDKAYDINIKKEYIKKIELD